MTAGRPIPSVVVVVRRVLTWLLVVLLGWVALMTGPAAAAASAESYNYGGHQVAEHSNGTSVESDRSLGPGRTTVAAPDLRSQGASTRPSGSASGTIYAYDDIARLVHSALGSHVVEEPAGNAVRASGAVQGFHVAANTGTARFVVNSAGDVLDTTRVSIPAGKFDYLLKNPSKSGVFSDSMGFDQAGLDSALRSHLTGNFGSASPSVPMVGGGTKFTVRGPMTGPSGQTWDITTAWGVDPNGTIRLITATP